MPPAYQQCARVLFEQFRCALKTPPLHPHANLLPNGVADHGIVSIAQPAEFTARLHLHLHLHLHLPDGCGFRPAAGSHANLLGETQRQALQDALLPDVGINLVASGTTLNDWKMYYQAFVCLRAQAQ